MRIDPQRTAERVLGSVRWTSPTQGFCRCPGEALHTTRTAPDACRVHLDGAPTLHCFHSHCRAAVDSANLALRRALGGCAPPAPPSAHQPPPRRDEVTSRLSELAPAIFETLAWPYDRILASSPVPVAQMNPQEQFLSWLALWPRPSVIWMGDVRDTGSPQHASHFQPLDYWERRRCPLGNFTCPSSFMAGTFSRADENVAFRHFLVVESDDLNRDQVGAVFRFLVRRLRYRLHCIIDTGGKSLHAWFSPPPKLMEKELKAALAALRCDPKMFGRSQPCRVPGAWRGDRLQKLIWRRECT